MKNRFEQKNATTIIDSPWAIFELNMRLGTFSIMCHLLRGPGKKALLIVLGKKQQNHRDIAPLNISCFKIDQYQEGLTLWSSLFVSEC